MPSKGPAYPASKEWKKQVRDAIDALIEDPASEINSDADFARHARVRKSSLSEALSPARKQTPLMPRINAALGWPKPRVLSTPKELEAWTLWEAMSEYEQGQQLERVRAAVERQRAEKERAAARAAH